MMSNITIAAAVENMPRSTSAHQLPPVPRVALICDYLEERWPSMDLFGDMLFERFTTEHCSAIEVERMRPALRNRFSKLPGPAGLFRNADRLLNRFWDYPAWLKQRVQAFDLFHLVDHSYAQLLLAVPGGRGIVTCHDLDTFQCLLDPASEPRPRWFRAMAQRTLNGFLGAAHVICVSSFTRAKILDYGLIPDSRLSVIHPGADPAFFAPADAGVRSSVPVTHRNYLLHVGSTIRRKRIDILLRVFERVARGNPDLELVRVGGPLTAEQSRLAEELGIAGKIVITPHLTKQQLAEVYRHARMVLQTSDAEGFGLPVIEALACGCPVLASDLAPLREAGGAAAEYCPVGDVEAWAAAVARLDAEYQSSPEQWELRRQRARRHALSYTWTENAKRTISVYERVLGQAAPLAED
jgi:glycosyltransferase involved in cell wall biosynthesis